MNKEKEQLKMSLTRIKENDFNLSIDENVSDYLHLMLEHIGDTDPVLRDNLIYTTFVHWIEYKKYFSSKELIELLDTITSEDFMFYNIGSLGEDSVFRRSFSALLVNPIVCAHHSEPFLEIQHIKRAKEALIRYIAEEKDLRGYVKEKGWAHSLGHAADGLDVLLPCPGITEQDCIDVIKVFELRLFEGSCVFAAEEDERLVSVLYYGILDNSLLNDNYIANWLDDLGKVVSIEDKMTRYNARLNVKNFARSLYFRLLHLTDHKEVTDAAIALEKKLNLFLD